MNRFAFAVYSDDIRQELGNKISLVGVYREKMFVSALPAMIPKLCVSVWARTPEEKPFQSLKLKLFSNDKMLFEQVVPVTPVDEEQSAPPAKPLPGEEYARIQTAHFGIQLSPLAIEGPTTLRIRIQTEDEELKAGGLKIELAAAV